jgi:hypothetical protein
VPNKQHHKCPNCRSNQPRSLARSVPADGLAYKRRQKGAGYSARAMFTARGFSYSTIRTLAIAGIDAPERLLFATETDLRSIAGINEKAFQEIAGYRCRFVSPDYRQPFEAPSPVSLDALRQAIIIPHDPDRVIP